MRWSEDDLKAYREGRPKIEPTKRHKFGARTTRRADGRTYASKLEAARAADLELQQRVGMIRNLREQVRYPLTDGTGAAYRIRSARVPKGRTMTFVADFVYERQMPDRTWNEMIEDVKGFDTPTARVKRAIAEQLLGTKIELVRAEKRAAR